MLKQAFDLTARLHSRAATLKRLGTPDIYSPIRITPSNYFRFLAGPSSTTIHGREFIIPVVTMTGHATQLITFGEAPTQGGFHLTYSATDSTVINWDDVAAAVQTALRTIPALASVTVTGNFTVGFTVKFVGVNSPGLLTSTLETLLPLQDTDDEDVVITIAESTPVAWTPLIKRGDKIVDPTFGNLAIDEIIEIPDLGGAVMGYRVRTD